MKKLLNFRYPFYTFLALLFGSVVARSLYAGDVESIVIVCACFLFAIVTSVCYKKILPLCLIVVFFFIGNGWYFLGESQFLGKEYNGENVVIGRVCDVSFVQTSSYSSLILENVSINGESAGNVRVFIYGDASSISVGDKVSFESELEREESYTLGVFNLTSYRNGVRYTASAGVNQITVVEGDMKIDEAFRLNVKNALLSSMSEENAHIAYAVLFGDKTMIDDNTYEIYRSSGIIHILTVSGLHVAFLAGAIYFFLKLFKANKYVIFGVLSVVLLCYCYLCSFSPSVVRATIMAIVLCLSSIARRPYDNLNSLAIAGFIIILFSPLSAVDVGFLMSFCSVLCIFLFTEPLTKCLSFVMPKSIASAMAVSLSAQIGILPFTSSFFSTFNFLSVFANIIILPFFSIVFPLLFVFAFLSSFMPFLSGVFIIFDYCFVFINSIASFFASTSLQIPLKPFSLSVSMFIILLLFSLSGYLVVKPFARLLIASILSFCLAFSIILPAFFKSNFSSISFVESYSGQMVVLTSKNGDCLYWGDDYYYQRFSSLNQNFEVDFYLGDDISLSQKQDWKNYGAKYFLTTVDNNEDDEIVLSDLPMQVGDFSVSFVKNCFLIEFDNLKVLIAQENVSQANLIDLLNEQNCDIIYLGDFVLQSKIENCDFVICNQKQEFSNYNLSNEGNFLINLETYRLGRLD